MITSNGRDFARIHGDWANQGRDHAGIVIITDQQAPRETIGDKINRLLASRSADELRNTTLYINGDPSQRLW